MLHPMQPIIHHPDERLSIDHDDSLFQAAACELPIPSNLSRIPIAGPWITEQEIAYVTEAARSGWYENAQLFVNRFEKGFARYIGRRFAIALPSGTSALHLALAMFNIGPGDEVILPDLTWIASAAPIRYMQAQPIFVDVDPRHWCLTVDAIRAHLSPRTRAIIAVDLYGNMPDLAALETLAEDHGLILIEDAAEALGSAAQGRSAGSFGHASAFSFHGSKLLTTGEGGMLVLDDENLYQRGLMLRDHGRPIGDHDYISHEMGFKYRMNTLSAALGLAQLERIDDLIARKRAIFSWYHARLNHVAAIRLNPEPQEMTNSFWMSSIMLDSHQKQKATTVIQALRKHRIDARPFFPPVSSSPAFRDSTEGHRAYQSNAIAYQCARFGLNLPSAPILSQKQVDYVCDVVLNIVLGSEC